MKKIKRIFQFRNKASIEEPQSKYVSLSDYIEGALLAIILGVSKAQKSEIIQESKAIINPPNLNFSDMKQSLFIVNDTTKDSAPRVELIEFDMLVTHTGEKDVNTGGHGGANLQVINSTLETNWRTKNTSSVANRIKFSIPVFLPSSPTKDEKSSE